MLEKNDTAPTFKIIDIMNVQEANYLQAQLENLREIQLFAIQQVDLIINNLNTKKNEKSNG